MLKHLDFIQLNSKEGLIILVTDTGVVQHKKIVFNHSFKQEEIDIIVNVLREKLLNKELNKTESELLAEIEDGFKLSPILNQFTYTVLSSLLKGSEAKVVTGGTANFLSQPEFNDLNKIRELLGVFEQQELLMSLLDHQQDGQEITVRIGDELIINEVRHCSLITANFSIQGKMTGKIGIIGPQRMDYERVIKILDFFSKKFDRLTD